MQASGRLIILTSWGIRNLMDTLLIKQLIPLERKKINQLCRALVIRLNFNKTNKKKIRCAITFWNYHLALSPPHFDIPVTIIIKNIFQKLQPSKKLFVFYIRDVKIFPKGCLRRKSKKLKSKNENYENKRNNFIFISIFMLYLFNIMQPSS